MASGRSLRPMNVLILFLILVMGLRAGDHGERADWSCHGVSWQSAVRSTLDDAARCHISTECGCPKRATLSHTQLVAQTVQPGPLTLFDFPSLALRGNEPRRHIHFEGVSGLSQAHSAKIGNKSRSKSMVIGIVKWADLLAGPKIHFRPEGGCDA